ncbi:MAG TPA: hypothetical protein VNL70_11025, partial [Tepidisphaeraceae bacterium]|nr:hypothetical protein [Tepidisphaeraceae bacterium]
MAQTGPELLLKPWPRPQQVQAQAEFMMLGEGSTEATDDFDLAFYDLSGRVRLLTESRADPRFGFSYTHLNTSGDPRLPGQLVDTSVGLGVGIADWSGWLAGITVGLGYAAAGAFDDANGWYGMADFAIGREFDENSALGFVLNYDGNRTIFPDVPLPGFQYRKKLDNALLLAVGFPFSSIEYRPTAALSLSGTYYIPDDLTVRVDYKLAQQLAVFGEFRSRREA